MVTACCCGADAQANVLTIEISPSPSRESRIQQECEVHRSAVKRARWGAGESQATLLEGSGVFSSPVSKAARGAAECALHGRGHELALAEPHVSPQRDERLGDQRIHPRAQQAAVRLFVRNALK